MVFHRRVTFRCLLEDLTGWSDASHASFATRLAGVTRDCAAGRQPRDVVAQTLRSGPHLSKLDHSVIRYFDRIFAVDEPEIKRESISAATDRLWWKLKTARWRGAALPDLNSEVVWLCVAGLRSAGSRDDFYERFERECSTDSSMFLPEAADELLREIEQDQVRLSAWRLQIQVSILVMIGHAVAGAPPSAALSVRHPKRDDTLASVSVSIDELTIDGDTLTEALVVLEIAPGADEAWRPLLSQIVVGTLSSTVEDVRIAPVGSPGEFALSYGVYVDQELSDEVERALENRRPLRLSGDIHQGAIAHFSPREHLTEATVEGFPVEALCGHWFVPSADFLGKPTCSVCSERYDSLTPEA